MTHQRTSLALIQRVRLHQIVILSFATTVLAACSHSPASDLAVDKIPASQLQTMSFVALNDDKPGTAVNVQKYLATGRYTIVYYYSPYSRPEDDLRQALVQLASQRQDLVVRTVNVNRPEVQTIDWNSPVAQSSRINSLPYFFIFDPKQNLRAHGRPAYTQVLQWLGRPQ